MYKDNLEDVLNVYSHIFGFNKIVLHIVWFYASQQNPEYFKLKIFKNSSFDVWANDVVKFEVWCSTF